MQVEVADVGAELAGPGQADLRVQVGAVHVDLPAVLVDDAADLLDPVLEHAVRGGVGDHQRRQPVGVLVGLGAEVGEVDVAVAVAADGDDLHPGHDGARPGWCRGRRRGSGRRRGAPRRGARARRGSTRRPAYSPWLPALGWSETASKPVISASHALEVAEELLVALGLVGAGRTGAGRRSSGQVTGIISAVAFSFIVQEPSGIIDRSSERSFACEAAHVAHHLGLAVVAVEDRVGEERARPPQAGRDAVRRVAVDRAGVEAKRPPARPGSRAGGRPAPRRWSGRARRRDGRGRRSAG